jgi:hypothetical protein
VILSAVVTALLVAGAVLLVVIPVVGAVAFSREGAENMRLAELQPDAVVERIHRLHIRHPELIKADRLDRHDAYIWLNVGLWMYGLGVILAAAPNSNLSGLSWGTQNALGLCLLFGTTCTLTGTVLGARIGKLRILRRVSDNLLTELLGDDIRLPYSLGGSGMLSVSVAMWTYAETIIVTAHSRLLGTLGGGLSVAIGCMCLTLGVRFFARSRRYDRARDELIAELDRSGE